MRVRLTGRHNEYNRQVASGFRLYCINVIFMVPETELIGTLFKRRMANLEPGF